jgi:hypothetical protein
MKITAIASGSHNHLGLILVVRLATAGGAVEILFLLPPAIRFATSGFG